jgi:hypothetical protein
MTITTAEWPPLPDILALVSDQPDWRYPSFAASGGTARLQIWITRDGHLAVVTWSGEGTSVANAAEDVHRELRRMIPAGELAVIEHTPADDPFTAYWEQFAVDGGDARWRHVWPAAPDSPDYDRLAAWAARHGAELGMPPAVPQDSGR